MEPLNEPSGEAKPYTGFTEEGNILHIDARHFCGDNFDPAHIQAVGRIRSTSRNMPFTFFANTSGGVLQGFILRAGQGSWAEFDEEYQSNHTHIIDPKYDTGYPEAVFDFTASFLKMVDILKHCDPEKKFSWYHFGI